MKRRKTFLIKEEPNEFHDNILDIWGRQFKFDHEKGIAEWFKNSADAYRRYGFPDSKQFIVLRFSDGDKGREESVIENIDFVGMTSLDIEKALKRWGDPEAAKRGIKNKEIKVYGGHGNGGKFYMRQMFKESYFITYRDGKLSVFGFNRNKKYGFAFFGEKPFRDINMSPQKAIKFANIESILPAEFKEKIIKKRTGFTIVRGIEPSGMKTKIKTTRICEKLKNHPQARRLLLHIPVSVYYNGNLLYNRLTPDEIKPKPGFETPLVIPIPEKLVNEKDAEKIVVEMANSKYPSGKLVLYTSEVALERGSRFSDLNRIDFIGDLGVIASYNMSELGVTYYTQSVFIYGECRCPLLEDSSDSSVNNDRDKLIPNNKSLALLMWTSKQIDELAKKISDEEKKEQEEINKKLSSTFNDFLNEWKNKFMNKLFTQILTGPGEGDGGGSGSGGSSGGFGDGGNGSNGGNGGSGQGNQKGGGDKTKKGSKFPVVRLSGIDDDPLHEGQKVFLDPRQPVVYQRIQDVSAGIYWINTSSPLSHAIIEKYGAESLRWRDYLLQRYVDIFVKEILERIARKDPDRFNPDAVQAEISTIVSKVHEAAAQDLEGFLFDEAYQPHPK